MRHLLAVCMLLAFASNSFGAFSFSLSPTTGNLASIGVSNQLVYNVIVQESTAGIFGTGFTMTPASVTAGAGNTGITFAFTPSNALPGPFTATQAGLSIGTITASVGGAVPNGATRDLTFSGTITGNNNGVANGTFTASATITAVPEPTSLGLVLLGSVGLALRRRRK